VWKDSQDPESGSTLGAWGEGRGLRSSSGVGECSQTPDHVEDMDDMLLAQKAKLAQR
jgi:hypothetical protein